MFPIIQKRRRRKKNCQLERDGGKSVISKIVDGDPIPQVLKEFKRGENQFFCCSVYSMFSERVVAVRKPKG